MKTFRLITAMIVVVGLIGVFSAFSAEQTNQGKKEGIITDTPESKDQKKGSATTIQAPAVTVQSLPLTITRLYLKDGTVHVVIKKQGSKRLSDEDYKATKLKVEASTLIKPLEWTLQQVDPQKRLNHLRREKDFDTGLAVTDRLKVTATLYRGLWKTAKEGTLSPMMAKVDAKTPMGTPKKKDTFDDQMLVERRTQPSKFTSGIIKETMDAPGRGSRGVAKGGPRSYGIVVEQPRWGEIYVLGEPIPVVVRLDEGVPGGEVNNMIIMLRGQIGTTCDQELFSGNVRSGEVVEVVAPEDCEEGFDYLYYIYAEDPTRPDILGHSGSFNLVSRTGPCAVFATPRDIDWTPTEIRVLQPDNDDIWRFPADGSSVARFIQWQVYPLFMPVHENFELQCYTEDGRPAGELIEISPEEFSFDHELRQYTVFTDIKRFGDLEPGRYRLEVRLVPTAGDDFPAVSGRGYLFTVGETVPTALLERALADGCIQVIDPAGNTNIHAGTDLRVRWELSPDLEELIEFVRGPFGAPVFFQVWLYEGEPDDGEEDRIRYRHNINNADARSYNLPLSPTLPAGTYYVRVIVSANMMYCGRVWNRSDTSNTFTILRP